MSHSFQNGGGLFPEVRTPVWVASLTPRSSAGGTRRLVSSRIWQMFARMLQELTFGSSFWALVRHFGTPANAPESEIPGNASGIGSPLAHFNTRVSLTFSRRPIIKHCLFSRVIFKHPARWRQRN